MEGIATYFSGFSDIAAKEIENITGQKAKEKTGALVFPVNSLQELATLAYKGQSLHKVMLLLEVIEYEEEESLENLKADVSSWVNEKTFRVNCIHDETAEVSGMEIAAKAGEVIVNKTGAKASMKNPDVIFVIYIYNSVAYLCVDFSGFDLSKRDYKIYNHPSALNGAIGYCFIKTTGWEPGMSIMDPMCGSGIIPIEAAFEYTGKSPRHFQKDRFAFTKFLDFDFEKTDKEAKENKKSENKIYCSDQLLASLRATKNNAKIAEVDRIISPTKCDLEWLETKFDEKSIDVIATHPPSVSKHSNVKELKKVYNELFYQAEYILKDEGVIGVISNTEKEIVEAAQNNKFSLKEKRQVWQRRHEFTVMIFNKNS